MTILLPPAGAIDAVLGAQRVKPGAALRLSRHCLPIPCEDGLLLYHTLTNALVLCQSSFDDAQEREALAARWFLVPEDLDDCALADQVCRVAAALKKPREAINAFTVLTTTDCNARCYYCYERGIPRAPMSVRTAHDVGQYIARVCRGEDVSISWFGGEPLYQPAAMDEICAVLRERGIAYSSKLTSNGFYLDRDMASRAVRDWHIRRAQITVDGTEAVYNRTKAYIDGGSESPYRRVLANIEAALREGIEVTVRLNMDAGNADDLMLLADELAARFGGYPHFRTHVILLFSFVGKIRGFASPAQAVEKAERLRARLKDLGILLSPELPHGLRVNRCMADSDNAEVIFPDGRISKCEHYREDGFVGSIYSPARDAEQLRLWKEPVRFPSCRVCALYPLCHSLKRCDWDKDGCPESRRLLLQASLREAALQHYLDYRNREGVKTHEA